MDLKNLVELYNKLTALQRAGVMFTLTLLNIGLSEKNDKK